MRCSHCGHINPYENNFCGICGAVLSTRWQATDATARATRITLDDSNTASHVARMTLNEPLKEPEQPRITPSIAVAPPEPPPASESRSVKANGGSDYNESGTHPSSTEEPVFAPLSVGGPSFLGLNEPADGNDYSYLMEDEHSSHAGVWVLLLLLAVLGGLTYWKWEPIRGFVVDTALRHSSPRQGDITASKAPADQAPATPDTSSVDQPTISVAKPAEPAEPAASNSNDKNAAAKSGAAASKAAGTAQSANAGKPRDSAPEPGAQPEAKTNSASNENSKSPEKSAQPAPANSADSASDEGESASKSASAGDRSPDATDTRATAKRATRAAVPVAPGAALLASGERYLYGQGVQRNCGQALVYMRSAADQGNAEAMSHLGALYATGECAPFDRAAAYSWFARAMAAKRNPYVERNLDMLWRDMTPQERQRVTK